MTNTFLAGLSGKAFRRLLDGPDEFLEMLPVALYLCDTEGRVIYANAAACELAGRTPRYGEDRWCVAHKLYWPDGRPLPLEECPMAIAIKERRPIRNVEAVAERPDGSRVRFMPHPTPLFDENGEFAGAVNMLVDITQRYEAEIAAARLAAVVATCDDAIVSKTLEGRVTTWNQGAARIFGYAPEEMIGRSIKKIIPPELQDQEDWILGKIRRGERVEPFETQRVTKDGRRIDISVAVSPVLDREGRVVGASKVARDITARKQAERNQALLIGELNHRVKNALAIVQSIATQTLRRTKDPAEFVASFTGRIQALARIHAVLSEQTWRGAELTRLLSDQLLIGGPLGERIVLSGPALTLEPQAALHLALITYELGTNARKYGSLSGTRGELRVTWEVVEAAGRRVLNLTWAERGGPKVTAPTRSGFGTRLVEQSLKAHNGAARLRYGADGLTCEIRLPLASGAEALYDMPEPGDNAEPEEVPSSELRGREILIVEDEPLVAMELEAMLGRLGCKVIGPAGNLAEASQLIESAEFEAALLDANLAGASVDGLAAALVRRGIPFAFASGYGRSALPAGYREAPLVPKPFNEEELTRALAMLLHEDARVVRLRRRAE